MFPLAHPVPIWILVEGTFITPGPVMDIGGCGDGDGGGGGSAGSGSSGGDGGSAGVQSTTLGNTGAL